MKEIKRTPKIKRTPIIKRTPVKIKDKKRILMLRWRLMRNAENDRNSKLRVYNRYKNSYFISIIKEATGVEYWSDFDVSRMKHLRVIVEEKYNIPINFYYAFLYYSTYYYMGWSKRMRSYGNYLGFVSSEFNLVRFANFITSKSKSWRIRRSKFPDDYESKYGIKTSAKTQKLGPKDKVVKYDLMSDQMMKKINKYL